MTDVEQLVRDTLQARAASLPPASLTVAPPSGRRRWVAVGLAAAVTAGVVVGVSVVSRHPQATAPASSFAPVPAGMREISYHGITLDVPASWPIGDYPCGTGTTTAVLVDDGTAYKCVLAVRPLPTSTQVYLDPIGEPPVGSPNGTLNGHPSAVTRFEASPSQRARLVLSVPDLDVRVTVEAPTQTSESAVLETVRVTPIDRNGCQDRLSPPAPSGNPASSSVLPGKPISGVVCEYVRSTDSSDLYWLIGSRSLSRAQIEPLRAAVQSTVVTRPPDDLGPAEQPPLLYSFRYRNGSTRTLLAITGTTSNKYAPPTVTDGVRTVEVPLDVLPTPYS